MLRLPIFFTASTVAPARCESLTYETATSPRFSEASRYGAANIAGTSRDESGLSTELHCTTSSQLLSARSQRLSSQLGPDPAEVSREFSGSAKS